MINESLTEEDIYETVNEPKVSVQYASKYMKAYCALTQNTAEVSLTIGAQSITFTPQMTFAVQNSASNRSMTQDFFSVIHNMIDSSDPDSVRIWNAFIERLKAIVLDEHQLARTEKRRLELEQAHERLAAQTMRASNQAALYSRPTPEQPMGGSDSHPALSQPVVPPMRAGEVPISEEVKTSFFNKV